VPKTTVRPSIYTELCDTSVHIFDAISFVDATSFCVPKHVDAISFRAPKRCPSSLPRIGNTQPFAPSSVSHTKGNVTEGSRPCRSQTRHHGVWWLSEGCNS
jgi:hypothetical protein